MMNKQVNLGVLIIIATQLLAHPSFGADPVQEFVGTVQKKTIQFVGKDPCPSDRTHFYIQAPTGSLVIGTNAPKPDPKVRDDLESKLSPFLGKSAVLSGRRHHIEWDCDGQIYQCTGNTMFCDWIEFVEIKAVSNATQPNKAMNTTADVEASEEIR